MAAFRPELVVRDRIWFARYISHGFLIEEPTGTSDRGQAEVFLRRKLAGQESGAVQQPREGESVSLELAKRQILIEYEINERKSSWRVKIAFGHLEQYFGRACQLAEITGERLLEYASHRLAKVSRGTVRYELRALHAAMNLLYRIGRMDKIPPFPKLKASDPRQGFFEDAEFEGIMRELAPDMVAFLRFLYWTGWRLKEATALKWANVDMALQIVRLEVGTTKNDEGRVFPYGNLPQLRAVIEIQRKLCTLLEAELGRVIPWLFFWIRKGTRMKAVGSTWVRACRRAGLPGRHIHDLRRTAVRRLERAGVPRPVAMKLTGHRSERIYATYSIVREADLGEGVGRLAEYVQRPQRECAESSDP